MINHFERISPDALQGLVEEFITREGTDYGWEEFTLATKVEQVKQQLRRGEVVIVFDPASESVSLLTKHQAREFLDNLS